MISHHLKFANMLRWTVITIFYRLFLMTAFTRNIIVEGWRTDSLLWQQLYRYHPVRRRTHMEHHEGFNAYSNQQLLVHPKLQQNERFPPSTITTITIPLPTDTMSSRRSFVKQSILPISFVFSGLIVSPDHATAIVETIGKDPNCNDATCLGIWDGLLANCPHPSSSSLSKLSFYSNTANAAGCVSSQDDTPGIFAEPWDYSDDSTISIIGDDSKNIDPLMDRIIDAIQKVCDRRSDSFHILLKDQRYLHVLFTDNQSGEVSDGEFYITPNDTTIQFRIASSSSSSSSVNSHNSNTSLSSPSFLSMKKTSLRNIERAELIRKELRWLKLPILRNRQRALFFIESDFDTFGPQSAALGPPEEMRIRDIDGQ